MFVNRTITRYTGSISKRHRGGQKTATSTEKGTKNEGASQSQQFEQSDGHLKAAPATIMVWASVTAKFHTLSGMSSGDYFEAVGRPIIAKNETE